ncbi:peptidase s41 family protein [Purpureocillium lilacinum]|uniref:Peptidase s41 family protein n=1 Tax=Purpureocillium lilacinum TaxID=33203 RepID=A0A179H0A9_PURLI|nr:peptidase s41 family protein [Purpureocillium lilacinum]
MAKLALLMLLARLTVANTFHQDDIIHFPSRDTSSSTPNFKRAADPCAAITQAWEERMRTVPLEMRQGKLLALDLRPSVATACLESVPLNKQKNLQLLTYLKPFLELQSTIGIISNPPEEYLLSGVDFPGGMDAMQSKLENSEYKSQTEFVNDLMSLIVSFNDNHLAYNAALNMAFRRGRTGIATVRSISSDGLQMPEIFFDSDLLGQGNKPPSAVESIDGVEVSLFMEQLAIGLEGSPQDPDAQYNRLFPSLAGMTTGQGKGMIPLSIFDIPDNHTVKFKNGTSRVVLNEIVTLRDVDLTGIRSGQDFQNKFESPQGVKLPQPPASSPTQSSAPSPPSPPSPPAPQRTLQGYPKPLIEHPQGLMSGYLPDGEGLENTAVITILGFTSLRGQVSLKDPAQISDLLRGARDVVFKTAAAAKQQGREKLVIDLQANGGGKLQLVEFLYRSFFPEAAFDTADRYRLTDGLKFIAQADYESFAENDIQLDALPMGLDEKPITDAKIFFKANPVKGQNATTAFTSDKTKQYLVNPDEFLPGSAQAANGAKAEAPWKPEDMVILTDGLCSSACASFTGLMVRNVGIRTVALGGRPLSLPMQAIGGVKGGRVNSFAEIRDLFEHARQQSNMSAEARQFLQSHDKSIPSIGDSPLRPLVDEKFGGSINIRNTYTLDDLDGFPLQFKYKAANCRLFYTKDMIQDITATWNRVAGIAFRGAPCAPGSTVNKNGTIGFETPGFTKDVKSRVRGLPVPTIPNRG